MISPMAATIHDGRNSMPPSPYGSRRSSSAVRGTEGSQSRRQTSRRSSTSSIFRPQSPPPFPQEDYDDQLGEQDGAEEMAPSQLGEQDGAEEREEDGADHGLQQEEVSILPEHLQLAAIEEERRLGEDLGRTVVEQLQNLTQAFKIFIQRDTALTEQMLSSLAAVREIARKKQNLPRVPPRLQININCFNHFPNLRKMLIDKPFVGMPALENGIGEVWRTLTETEKLRCEGPRASLYGYMHDYHITPRRLNSQALDRLSCIEGVVNKASAVIPKVVRAVYVGESQANVDRGQKSVYVREFFDVTNMDKSIKDMQPPPHRDPSTDLVYRFETGMSVFKNQQKFVLQEAPESVPSGVPRFVEVIVEDDLVDKVKCGDRIRVWGVYRISIPRAAGAISGLFRPFFVSNGIGSRAILDPLSERCLISCTLQESILEFSRRSDALEVVSRSIAPSIFGHRELKMGLALMLFGGAEVHTATHKIRGDIHVMLVGDPSCGKSQIMRYIMHLLPGCISATGRGSSGVGLTAAVITDADSGERRVEGGACVMGDRHIVCIDEFDKMKQADTVAIHEVMEQQTVTVAKAGIHTVLNARCSILAAANPMYGCWSEDIDYGRQLNFPSSLMSRFDLIFVIRDSSSEATDDRISRAVLGNLQSVCRPVGPKGDAVSRMPEGRLPFDLEGYEPQHLTRKHKSDPPMFAQTNYITDDRSGSCVLSTSFLRNYVNFAKYEFYHQKNVEGWTLHPELTEGAARKLAGFYGDLREKAKQSVLSTVTVRTLEGLTRLATAHARLKLKRYVDKHDADAAIRLVLFTVLGEAVPTEEEMELEARRKRPEYDSSSEEEEGGGGAAKERRTRSNRHGEEQREEREEDEEEDDEDELTEGRTSTSSRRRTSSRREGGEPRRNKRQDEDEENEEENVGRRTRRSSRRSAASALHFTSSPQARRQKLDEPEDFESLHHPDVPDDRVRAGLRYLVRHFASSNFGATVNSLLSSVNHMIEEAGNKFTKAEFMKTLLQLDEMETQPIVLDRDLGIVYPVM